MSDLLTSSNYIKLRRTIDALKYKTNKSYADKALLDKYINLRNNKFKDFPHHIPLNQLASYFSNFT